MFRTLAIAAVALSATAAATAPAFADAYCGPSYYYSRHWGDCQPYGYRQGYYETVPGAAVGGAGYVAGSAVNAAGNVAGAAIGTAGAIVGGVLGR